MPERNSYSIPRLWRLKETSLNLKGDVCTSCGQPHFPPRPTCFNSANHASEAGQPTETSEIIESNLKPEV